MPSKRATTILLVLLAYILDGHLEAQPESNPGVEILHPLSYNAYLNQPNPGVFHCQVHLTEFRFIRWLVNNHQSNSEEVRTRRNISVTNELLRDTTITVSRITIPATSINSDGINLKCKVYYRSGSTTLSLESSETGIFNVQGLLVMLPTVITTDFNNTHYMVQWLEPFSHNLTLIQPNIYNYTVCMSINGECTNVTDTEISVLKYFFDNECEIRAWNVVGESENSASLVIKSCTEVIQEYDSWHDVYEVQISFQDEFSTTVQVHSFGLNTTVNTTNDCLYLFNVKLYNIDSSLVSNTTRYNYSNTIIKLEKQLIRNSHYMLILERLSSSHRVVLHQSNFSTYDVQQVRIIEERDTIIIICDFVSGTRALGFQVTIENNNGTELLIRQVHIANPCGNIEVSLCSQNTSIGVSELNFFGNFTLSVYDWELDGSITKVFSQEYMNVTYFSPITETDVESDTTLAKIVSVSNNTTATATTTTYASSTENKSALSVFTLSGSVGGATIVVLVLLVISIAAVVICKAKRKDNAGKGRQAETTTGVSLQTNEAYALVVPQMNRNEAYVRVTTRQNNPVIEPPHVYDEIDHMTLSIIEPVYAEVANKDSEPHNPTVSDPMTSRDPVQDGHHYDNIA